MMFNNGMKVNTPLGTAIVIEAEVVKNCYYFYNRHSDKYTCSIYSDKLKPTGRFVVKLDNPSNWSFKNTNPAMWPNEMAMIK